ncbi:MAG: sigma-70 family RNA polymerase sigma factor [Clostridia bacterium]|nr:sigma-70 family RNA polymerase sigma factor [Clostridia bacterium]
MVDIMVLAAALESEEERSMAARIFTQYQNAMYWTAYDVLKNCADAEDAVMKAAENICQHIHDFDCLSETDTKRKVKVMVQNAAIDLYRKKSKENVESIDAYWAIESDEDGAAELVDEEIRFGEQDLGALQKHVLKLKEKHKVVLLMKYVDSMSNKEIAERLHIPESTVATHLQRAKQQLKAALEKEVKR